MTWWQWILAVYGVSAVVVAAFALCALVVWWRHERRRDAEIAELESWLRDEVTR